MLIIYIWGCVVLLDKKIILFLSLIFLVSFVYSESLNSVVIPSNVSLNKELVIYGFFDGDVYDGNILCSFRIFDIYEDKRLIWRLSDEYTSADGFVNNSPFVITEPVFQRGIDYNAVICCSVSCVDQSFSVGQKEDVALGKTPEALIWDLHFWTDKENSLTVFLILCGCLIVVGSISYFFKGR